MTAAEGSVLFGECDPSKLGYAPFHCTGVKSSVPRVLGHRSQGHSRAVVCVAANIKLVCGHKVDGGFRVKWEGKAGHHLKVELCTAMVSKDK